MTPQSLSLERVSIEVTNRCAKACWFCYNHSAPEGDTRWAPDELVTFVGDCAAHGVKAVSFGGGEPLQYEGLWEVLARLRGVLFRSVTSNGLLLHGHTLDRPLAAEVRASARWAGTGRWRGVRIPAAGGAWRPSRTRAWDRRCRAWAWTSAEAPMDSDFPAAHSMDTLWYAVDEKGQVALFATG